MVPWLLNENVKFVKRYKTNKPGLFCSNKDDIQFQQKTNVVYRITCSGCYKKYTRKTGRNVITRMDEHDQPANQPMFQYLTNCAQYAECLQFYALPDTDFVNTIVSKQMHLHNAVSENTEIIDHNDNWTHLQYLEDYYIKIVSIEINIELKAPKKMFQMICMTVLYFRLLI